VGEGTERRIQGQADRQRHEMRRNKQTKDGETN